MQRLRTRAQFQAVLAGPVVARSAHFALHRLHADAQRERAAERAAAQPLFAAPGLWLGVLLPKRVARRAVTRNAIRRQIYAVAALFATRLVPAPAAAGHSPAADCTVAHVVRLRAGFERKQFVSASSAALRQAVRAELLQLFAHGARRAAGRETAPAAAPAAPAGP